MVRVNTLVTHPASSMSKNPKYEGKWLKFCAVSFTNSEGQSREWEYATRIGSTGAASIIAIQDGNEPKIVLVKQIRPPINNYALEFPAGLIDSGESIESAALRELEEETGYLGEIVHIGPSIYSSPGLTDEHVSLVTINVTGKVESKTEPDEVIEVVILPLKDLHKNLTRIHSEGISIDAKLWSFAQGLSWNLPD